ncbi:MAG: DUF6671 family protein [Halieaceae bacterium]|jgi:hypothetical protein|nr:DUF6671 family protein [Halieaceae bacterium]
MFAGRTLVIATRHAKERVIAPILERALGVRCITPDALDTDELGTFTGEIERRLDPVETGREKCRRAMDATGCDLAVANEGSFGPHPVMAFVPGDDEIMVFLDRRHGLELVVREVSASTNFAAQEIRDEDALLAFAARARFPGHALILRESPRSREPIHKGINEPVELLARFREFRARLGHAYVETDMRAMHNPTRMEVIGDAARKLVDLLQSTCPTCGMPGFAVTDVIRGLPCELCGLPTNAPSRHISVCGHCGHREELRNPHGKTREDPRYCEFCNP